MWKFKKKTILINYIGGKQKILAIILLELWMHVKKFFWGMHEMSYKSIFLVYVWDACAYYLQMLLDLTS